MYTLLPFRFLQDTQQYLKLIMTSESRVGIVLTPGNYLVTEFDRLQLAELGSGTLAAL